MTLADMADFICGKVNQSETEDVTACKGFLKRRHDMLWNEALWKDSLLEYRQTLSPTGYALTSTWLPTKGVLLLPSIIQRVLGVRSDTRKLNVQRPEYFYRIDYDAFAQTGDASDYILLPPCVWELNTGHNWWVRRENVADAAVQVTTDILPFDGADADGATVARSTDTLAEEYTRLAGRQFDRLDRIAKLASTGDLTLSVAIVNSSLADFVNASDTAVQVGFSPTANVADIVVSITAGAGVTVALGAASLQYYLFLWDPLAGAYIEPATGFNDAGPTLRGTITWDGAAFTITRNPDLMTFSAAATSLPLRQRIRLIEIPTAELTIRVLGKRTVPTFDIDSDEPALSSSENCLIAFAQGDMLQRERQYAKAQELFQEGSLLLDQLKRVETVQQAHNARIIPEGGYGCDYLGIDSKAGMF